MVLSQNNTAVLATTTDVQVIKGTDNQLEVLAQYSKATILGFMGGPAHVHFIRAAQLGHEVWRVPWHRLRPVIDVHFKAPVEVRAQALLKAWRMAPDAFYRTEERDIQTFMIRELTRARLAVQGYRIRAQQKYEVALRSLDPVLPDECRLTILTRLTKPALIAGAKEDERALEKEILKIAHQLPVWGWMHPDKDSVLPRIKGLGAALGGAVIGEIGDIRRFPSPNHLRSYARFGVSESGMLPIRRKGEASSWNHNLTQAVWLWSSDQMPRYEHPWRWLYDREKVREFQAHPDVVQWPVQRKASGKDSIPVYTLQHLDARAKRKVGSLLLVYLHGLLTAGEESGDPERWYEQSHWPELFANTKRELDEGKRDYLKREIERRKSERMDEGDPL